MNPIPFQTTDWMSLPEEKNNGTTGFSSSRTLHYGDLRIRLVKYSANYLADHWCKRGHILYCMEGELTTELEHGQTVTLRAGMSYQVSDDMSSHRSSTLHGATLFIVDGGFLGTNKSL
ncbi:MAG: DHCW motif cupin fold protein [Cyclobacteriaceae bacterium]|nr:DHCW motif cupin fold protein [Cyclobacteriaceae bacterium]